MGYRMRPILRPLCVSLALVSLAGCAAKRAQYDLPSVPMTGSFKRVEASVAPIEGEAKPVDASPRVVDGDVLTESQLGEWWQLLHAAELDRLVDRVLANNHDLRIATSRIAQARARMEQAAADELPTVSLPYQAKIEAPFQGVGRRPAGAPLESRQTYQLGPRIDWRVDLWGERSALAESADMQLWRTTYQRDDARRSLIASTVSLYVEYLSLNDRVKVARDTEKVLRDMLASVRARMEVGDATATEFEQQKAAVYSVQATIPALLLQRENVINALAILAGAPPVSLALEEKGLASLTLPAVLPGLPASLLVRRPDVRVVEARLLAADADIDVARTRILPQLDLSAQVGYGSLSFSRLFQSSNLFWNAVANLSATIFDYGKRANEAVYAKAVYEELVETYVKVVYTAIRETEDGIAAAQMNGEREQSQLQASDAAERAWRMSIEAYDAGAIDYLTLLDTQRTYHRNLDELHRVRMERFRGVVSLFAAMGGGVPAGDALPGKGGRPARFAASGNAPLTDEDLASIDWRASSLASTEASWLVELAGLQDRQGVVHVWRDLRQRFSTVLGEKKFYPRLQGRVASDSEERATWYRVFVGAFANEAGALEFCRTLEAGMMRCRPLSAQDEQFSVAMAEPERAKRDAATVDRPTDVKIAFPARDGGTAPGGAGSEIRGDGRGDARAAQKALADSKVVHLPAAGLRSAHSVQLASARDAQEAEKAKATWVRKGYTAYVYPMPTATGGIAYTLRTGVYGNAIDASEQCERIRQREGVLVYPVSVLVDADGLPAPRVLIR